VGKTYLVSDGDLVLTLEEAGEGGFTVTSPADPGLVTEAETVSEAFDMARDALEGLARARDDLFRGLAPDEREAFLARLPQAERERLLRLLPPAARRELGRTRASPGRARTRSTRARKRHAASRSGA
jgi:predicted RNase H-like HicB family nuclease